MKKNIISLLARNGSNRVGLIVELESITEPIQIDKRNKMYTINDQGKLWIGELNGLSTEIEIPYLNKNSNLIIGQATNDKNAENIIYNNRKTLYIRDYDFNLIYTKVFDSEIRNLYLEKSKTLSPFILIETDNKPHIWKDGRIIEGILIDKKNPMYSVGEFNNKTYIVSNKNNFLFNYELKLGD